MTYSLISTYILKVHLYLYIYKVVVDIANLFTRVAEVEWRSSCERL